MKTTKAFLFYVLVFGAVFALTSCRNEKRHLEKAHTLYIEGSEKRHQKQSEAAAELFSQALLEIGKCDAENENVQQLKGIIEDDLGVMYWIHNMNEEALPLHEDALTIFRKTNDSVSLAQALRNCGRASASLQMLPEAQNYYEEALQIAQAVEKDSLTNDIRIELARDCYLETEDYDKAIAYAEQVLENDAETDQCRLILGVAYFYQGADSLALLHLQESVKSNIAGIRMSAYQTLRYLAEYQGNYEKALEYQELFQKNMMQADKEHRSEQVQHIKAEYDLQVQKNELQTAQRLKNVRLYLFISLLLIALLTAFFILRQKMLNDKLKLEQMKNQMELALKKNKVYVTALALSEQVTSSSLAFNLDERDWQDFIELTDFAYGDFTKRLMAQYPTLTDSDLQICCLTKQGFSNQVISILLGIQTASFARRKSYIKQEKMNGLNDERSFEEIINAV